MKSRLAKIASALALLALLSPGTALALTYSPPSFDLTADPGDTISDSLKVENETQEPLTIAVSVMNFSGKAGDETSGIPEFYGLDEIRDGRGLAPWISVVDKEVRLKPGERGSVPFQIRVPPDADPGSYFGALVLTTKSSNGGQGIGIIADSVSLVLLKVNGEVVEDLKLSSFSAAPRLADSLPIRFEARLENDGNVHERPYGEVTIRNIFGRTVAVLPMNRADNKSVLPGGMRRLETDWTGRSLPEDASRLSRQWNDLKIGPYTAELVLKYGVQQRLLTAKTTVWIVPWQALLLAGGGVAVLIYGLRKFLAWYHKRIIEDHERQAK